MDMIIGIYIVTVNLSTADELVNRIYITADMSIADENTVDMIIGGYEYGGC